MHYINKNHIYPQDLQHQERKEEEVLQWVGGVRGHAHQGRVGPVWSLPGHHLFQQEHLSLRLLQWRARGLHERPLRDCDGGQVHERPQTSHLSVRRRVSWSE